MGRVGSIVERLVSSGDECAASVAVVGILEGLRADGGGPARDHLGPASRTEFDALRY